MTIKKAVNSEDSPLYLVDSISDDATIQSALAILSARMRAPGAAMNSPQAVKDYLKLSLAEEEREVFMVLFLDTQHRVIVSEQLFHGTLTQTSVFPREVVKRALIHNAGSVIFSHNHPSGITEPSRSDIAITDTLKQALSLVDVKVLDHIIIGGMDSMSFAERG